MNLKFLNIGIANLVENCGKLELELHEERDQSKMYRKWWEDSQKQVFDLKDQILKKNEDFVEAVGIAEKFCVDLDTLQKELEKLVSEDKKTLKIESVLNRVKSILKKSKDANKNP